MRSCLCPRNPLAAILRRIVRLGTISIIFVIVGCMSEPAGIELTRDPLIAPVPQAPSDGRRYGYSPAGDPPEVQFVWRHGMPTAQVPSPHQAERMIICIYDQERGRCESGSREGVPRPIWFQADTDDPKIERTPIRQELPPFASPLDIDLGYEYRTLLRMRPEYRGRTLLWQVGACLSGTCRMSDPWSLRMEGRIGSKDG
jgi:hypothetical protein